MVNGTSPELGFGRTGTGRFFWCFFRFGENKSFLLFIFGFGFGSTSNPKSGVRFRPPDLGFDFEPQIWGLIFEEREEKGEEREKKLKEF